MKDHKKKKMPHHKSEDTSNDIADKNVSESEDETIGAKEGSENKKDKDAKKEKDSKEDKENKEKRPRRIQRKNKTLKKNIKNPVILKIQMKTKKIKRKNTKKQNQVKKVLTMRNIQTKRKKDIKNNHSTKSDGVINKGPANPMMELAGPFIFRCC